MRIRNYKDLNIWKKGIEIVDKTYNITANFPDKERYILSAQMQRSAVSIPSNIAEGFVRHHSREYKQFLYIALGSCAELETQLIISNRRGYITQEKLKDLQEDVNYESRMLMTLIKRL